jgi:hypothetical protein
METAAYLITKVLVGWPLNWKLNGGLGLRVASPLLMTITSAPWKLGRQVAGGVTTAHKQDAKYEDNDTEKDDHDRNNNSESESGSDEQGDGGRG